MTALFENAAREVQELSWATTDWVGEGCHVPHAGKGAWAARCALYCGTREMLRVRMAVNCQPCGLGQLEGH